MISYKMEVSPPQRAELYHRNCILHHSYASFGKPLPVYWPRK